MARKFVAYYRVSTDRQGRSGLGLDAQREAVLRHLASHAGELIGEFCEVESGRRSDRPQLAAAIAAAKKARATLIIAKLDRLARNVHFISGLMESGVDFVAADNPHANKLMVHMLAAFAEHEREQISQRTKDALAAAKARGIRLGRNAAERLAPAHRAAAMERARQLAPVLTRLKDAGMSARQMAAELTARGVPTPTGAKWHGQTVIRMLDRAGSLNLCGDPPCSPVGRHQAKIVDVHASFWYLERRSVCRNELR